MAAAIFSLKYRNSRSWFLPQWLFLIQRDRALLAYILQGFRGTVKGQVGSLLIDVEGQG